VVRFSRIPANKELPDFENDISRNCLYCQTPRANITAGVSDGYLFIDNQTVFS
jgi:hypothetical protein